MFIGCFEGSNCPLTMLRIDIVVPVHNAHTLLDLCPKVRERFSTIAAQCPVIAELGECHPLIHACASTSCTSLVSFQDLSFCVVTVHNTLGARMIVPVVEHIDVRPLSPPASRPVSDKGIQSSLSRATSKYRKRTPGAFIPRRTWLE